MLSDGRELSVLELVAAIRAEALRRHALESEKPTHAGRVRHYGSTAQKPEGAAALALHATVGEAVKAGRPAPEGADPFLRVRMPDLRYKRSYPILRADILFVLDVSRSAGFEKRLSFVKSAVMALLTRAYQDRDRVGLLTFGNKRADYLLPFTRSVEEAAAVLEVQRAQGNTPLAAAIRKASEILRRQQERAPEDLPFMILLSDGKANFDEHGDPYQEALKAAENAALLPFPSLVVDTDTGVFSLGLARELARRMNAYYVEMA